MKSSILFFSKLRQKQSRLLFSLFLLFSSLAAFGQGPCGTDVGTFTILVDGVPATSPIYLCQTACISITSNNDYVLPVPTSGEDSELMYALYNCSPTTTDPATDPCYSGLLWTGQDFSDCNNAGSILLGAGLGPDIFFIPITADDGDNNGDPNGVIHYDQNGDGCFDMGTPIEVYYTNPITFSATEDCANGSVTIVINGGAPEFSGGNYTVTNTGAGSLTGLPVSHGGAITITGLSNGDNYSISVVDGEGCSATFSGGPILMPSITGNTVVDVSCNGGSDGSITITNSGGTPPVQYSNNNGGSFQGSNSFTGLPAGTYDMVVQDNNGCQDIIQVTINEPPPLTLNTTSTNPTCNGGTDGSISITAGGGTPGYQYSIDNGVTFQAGNIFNGLGAGTYNVVIEDNNGCQTNTTVTLTDPPPVTFTSSTVDPTCGNSDGSITLTGAGGDGGPYSYSIDNGGTFQGSGTFNGLAAGTYNVVVEDASGCQGTGTVTLTDQSGPSIDNVNTTNPTCNGSTDGSITITASGGTTPYQYSIDNGVTFQASNSFTGLGAGTYNIVVEDATGCTASTQVTLTDPPAMSIDNVATTDPSCNGSTDGSITITASGGDGGPYQYSIDNGVTFQAGNSFTGLGAGIYDIVVEDGNGCQATTQVTLTDPPAMSIDNVATADPTCNGSTDGTITITASGGTTPYQYSIDNGVTFQASNSFTGLGAGIYDIVVEDANGCQVTSQVTLTDPPAVSIDNVATTDPACNGSTDGDITITASGGDGGPYQYSIDNGVSWQAGNSFTGLGAGTYDIIVEDGNGCQATTQVTLTDPPAVSIDNVATTDPNCGATDGDITITASGGDGGPYQYSIDNGATFQGSNSFTGLGAGAYNIVVEDGNGCQATTTVSLSNLNGPTIDNIATVDPTCNGDTDGSITITASGGVTPYQYSIDNGATFQVSNNFTGLGAGTYDIVVEDVNGCQAVSSITLTEPPAVSIDNIATTDPNCGAADGGMTITASGGDGGPYQYSIDNGTTFQASNSFTGLTSGTYDVVVEDASGCQATTQVTLNDLNGPSIDNTTGTDPLCNGGTDGSITITASGGTTPYQYSIDNGTTFQGANSFNGLGAGTYNIVVEDANGCQVTTQVTLTDPPALTYSAVVTNENCGQGNGSIVITPSGGASPYQYSNDGGTTFQAGGTFSNLGAGTYNMVIEDANGCQVTGTENIIDIPGPTIDNISAVDASCNGLCDGSATATVSGGATPYTYLWDDPGAQSTATATGLCAGTYTVTVTDGSGCTTTLSTTIGEPAPVIASFTATPDSGQVPLDVVFTNTSSGATSYLWDFGDGNNSILTDPSNTYTNQGTYTVILVASNGGCLDTAMMTINATGELLLVIPNVFSPNGDGINDLYVVQSSGIELFEGMVYNRWGQLMYKWDHAAGWWDGRTTAGEVAAEGTYYVVIKATGFDGTEFDETVTVTLIR